MNLLKKFPYLKKDILWAVALVILFLLVGSPTLTLPWVHNIIFIVFAIAAWKKKSQFNNKHSSILSVGRVFSLMTIIAVLFSFVLQIYYIFQSNNAAYLSGIFFVPIRFFLIFAVAIYALQYYIFSLWKTEFNFIDQKKLIILELIGIILIIFIGWSGFLVK
jgi:hypothetical protein